MCGVAGILHWGLHADAGERSRQMAHSIRHRGPDDEGYWSNKEIALGFVRLSILDIQGGHQPMCNEDGKIWVVFNGEIYNHRELRRQLLNAGHHFRSDHSDTEVLVHGWEEWGEALPGKLNGMFAFAIWDDRNDVLFIARDRYGIKPVYIARLANKAIVFASEIRAIHASNLLERREDCDGILEYFNQQNQWGERTLFSGVEEFPAGTWERFDRSGHQRSQYWNFEFKRDCVLSLAAAADQHRDILGRVVARQISADVPVMSYLSGGIDSSALVAAAHKLDSNVRAYSCMFDLENVGDDRIVDERSFSRSVVRQLNIKHVELELPQDSLVTSLDDTIRALECPRMGMAYPNYLVAKRVAQDSKVVLSGTGGDELHGGYVYRYQALAPSPLKPFFSRASLRAFLRNGRLGRSRTCARSIYADMLNFPIHWRSLSGALTPDFLSRITAYDPQSAIRNLLDACPYDDPKDMLMYVDARTYLRGLLVLEDKLSMAHSLEARVPLLDNELVDFVSTLPWTLLFDGTNGKIVFRESVRPWVSDAIYRKPKMGFGPPDASWYRTKLRPFIENTLAPDRIAYRGVFLPEFVKQTLDSHFTGTANNVALIWSLLSFESWCNVFGLFGGRKCS